MAQRAPRSEALIPSVLELTILRDSVNLLPKCSSENRLLHCRGLDDSSVSYGKLLSYAAPHDTESALLNSRKIYMIAFGADHVPANRRVFYALFRSWNSCLLRHSCALYKAPKRFLPTSCLFLERACSPMGWLQVAVGNNFVTIALS